MGFDLNEEQRILDSTVRRFIDTAYGFEKRREVQANAEGFSRAHWAQFADLGLLAIPFAEEDGGLGGGPVEIAVVISAFGRGLVLEPFFPTVVMSGGLLRHGASAAQRQEMVPDIVSGQSICAFAYAEAGGRYNLADVALGARKEGGGYVLDGAKLAVQAGPAADWLFVTARTAGGRRERDGITLFRIPAGARGLSRRDYLTIDGTRASDVTFDGVRATAADIIGQPDQGLPIVERVAEDAVAALCAEAVGIMEMLNEATIAYVKQRRAFGQPLSKFQVLQHRLVNMKIAAEQASAITAGATLALSAAGAERARLVSAAKAKVGKEARMVAQGAVQLHGGIGITDELNIGHAMKRLMAIEALFGDTAFHLRRFADLAA